MSGFIAKPLRGSVWGDPSGTDHAERGAVRMLVSDDMNIIAVILSQPILTPFPDEQMVEFTARTVTPISGAYTGVFPWFSDMEAAQKCWEKAVEDNFCRPIKGQLNYISTLCAELAKENGWDDSPVEDGTAFALIHSEISEAMEGNRKDLMDDKLPQRKMEEVELADAVIRIMHYAGRKGFDLGGALVEKLKFNQTRADHKPENRAKAGGKRY